MMLVIALKDHRQEIRVANISRAAGTKDSVVALDEQNRVVARFKKEDVQNWSVE